MTANLPAAMPASTTAPQPPLMCDSSDATRMTGAEDVDEQLDHVGPDDGRGAAAHRVDDHHQAEDDDDHADRDARHHGDHQRRRIQADAVGERARADEQPGAEVLDRRPEALPQQVVGRQQVAGEVGRHQQQRDQGPPEDEAGGELQEPEVAGVGRRRHADERQRARFGGDGGAADRPARDGPAGEEVVGRGAVEPAEPAAEGGDAGEIDADDEIVDQRHRRPGRCGRADDAGSAAARDGAKATRPMSPRGSRAVDSTMLS